VRERESVCVRACVCAHVRVHVRVRARACFFPPEPINMESGINVMLLETYPKSDSFIFCRHW